MNHVRWPLILALGAALAIAPEAQAQRRQFFGARPYVGFVYPAGGQQGTTFQIRLGGQGLDGVHEAIVSGTGVRAKIVEYLRRMSPQDMQLLREQVRDLRRGSRTATGLDEATQTLVAKIEKRMSEYVNTPACASIASLVLVEVTVSPDAPPGPREICLATERGGVSNPLVFHVGQLPEFSRAPMKTALLQVLGKEELALRKRPDDEIEQRITVPCTLNGQIASGEVNRYRFEARKGQRLVFSAVARQLVPFIADAVPGWFQPVMAIHDAAGKEMAYNDDYRFKPDPVILFDVPKDGEYVFTITDAIFRGREDFVYRVTIGELPFVTSIFPLGGRAGEPATIEMKGWNLEWATLTPPARDAAAGVYPIAARRGKFVSNQVPFALDTLPECLDQESNNDPAHAQKVQLPVIVNGRIDRPGDWDVFQVSGRADETLVAEVCARRLDSPLDSLVKITDASGKVLAFNDDHADVTFGVNTHHADSYLAFKLPADGTYYVHLGDVARHGGEEYGYRLRLSAPRPDFALHVVPSSVTLRSKSAGTVSVYAVRKDGFAGTIELSVKDPPTGFSLMPKTLSAAQGITRLTVRTDLADSKQPVPLTIQGRATVGGEEIVRQAVPAEDRMQAFLWRHLVPAGELRALVFDPSYEPPPKRTPRIDPMTLVEKKAPAKPLVDPATGKPKFTKGQVAGRLRQLKVLFEDGLLTDEFYAHKVAECEAAF